MILNQPHIFQSAHHNIKLVALQLDEPNPGRSIWKFQFFINDKLVNNDYLNYKWSGLHPELDEFEMESPDGNYIYIPMEDSAVYNVQADKYFQIQGGETKNNHFVKNRFSENRLIILNQRSIYIIGLGNFVVQKVIFPFGRYHFSDAYFYEDTLLVRYKDLESFNEYTKKYDFDKMDFEK